MKRFLTLGVLALFSFFAKADTDVSSFSSCIYPTACTGQIGSTVEMDIYAKIEQEGYGFSWSFARLPEGIHYVSFHNTLGWTGDGDNPTDPNNIMIQSYDPTVSIAYAPGIVKIATVTFSIDDDVLPGDYDITIFKSLLNPGHKTEADISATLTVQRPMNIQAMPEGYSLEVVPFLAQEGSGNLEFYLTSKTTLKDIEFDLELPQGILLYDSEFNQSTPTVNTASCYNSNAVPTTFTINSETSAHYFSKGVTTGAPKVKRYFLAANEPVLVATIPFYIVPTEEIGGWGNEYILGKLSEIKLNNINLRDVASSDVFTGNYAASVIKGIVDDVTDPILYGNFSSNEAKVLLNYISNARTLDISQTTGMTAESAATSLEGVYVQGATQSALMPKSQGTYRTVCVPFAVSGTGRYVISSVDASSITLSQAPETIPANTPFVATAGVVVGNESVYPQPTLTPETNAGAYLFKGLYQKTTINGGVYYIAQDKFWRADSDVTVAPFKAILTGSLAAKSLKIFIEDETGIREVTNQFDNEDIYNLQGIKLNKTQKGINIVGGKKVILK